jgi:hypothetical protein
VTAAPGAGPASRLTAVFTAADSARAQSWALLVARIATGVYVVEVLLNLTRPKVFDDEPTLSIFRTIPGDSAVSDLLGMPKVVFWLVLAGIVAGVVLQVVAAREPAGSPRATMLTWATLACLVGPFTLIPLQLLVFVTPLAALACVPATLVVLLVLHQIQRFVRLPLTMLVAALVWGALVTWGYTRACSSLAYGTVSGYLLDARGVPGQTDPQAALGSLRSFTTTQYRIIDIMIVHLSILGELMLGAGILLVLLLFRHRITDAVSGLVVGAAAGLGYTLVESAVFIHIYGLLAPINGATSTFEYWIRQTATLLTGRVTCGAILGAAIGAAWTMRSTRDRRLVVGAGAVAAIGADLAGEVVSAWLSHLASDHITRGSLLDTVILSPLWLLIVQVPFFLLALAVLRAGNRERAAAAAVAIPAEAATGGGAITAPEVPVLLNPALRLWLIVTAWRRLGPHHIRGLVRLHSAQFELAGWRWQEQRGLADPGEGAGLRADVMRLKQPATSGEVRR